MYRVNPRAKHEVSEFEVLLLQSEESYRALKMRDEVLDLGTMPAAM